MKKKAFSIIGISVRTTNENGQAGQDIPALWGQFMSQNLIEKIPNKISDEIYCIYTEYDGDYMKPYTTILGMKVKHLNQIPKGMVGKSFESGEYKSYLAKGNLNEGAVFQAWLKIWEENIPRKYSQDFEVYGAKAQNPDNAEVDIFIAV